MWIRPLDRRLARLFGARKVPPDAAARDRILDRIAPAGEAPRRLLPAMGTAAGALVVATAVACVVPAEVDVPLGVRIAFALDGQPRPDDLAAFESWATGTSERETGDRAEVRIAVRARDDGSGTARTEVDAQLVGLGLVPEDVEDLVQRTWPGARIVASEALVAPIETSLAEKLAIEVFRKKLDAGDVEAAKAALLASLEEELAREGLEGEAEVTIDRADGRTRVEVRVEAHGDLDADGHSTPDEP
ncbi:MAG: hypothetical protein D6705_01980 [Deltaproteobacteria bacterium]|nr:MAG: hypothetical protein D6705_01980 [Deltaproteobacteria bacterium]